MTAQLLTSVEATSTIGKVKKLLDERPWLTCSEIAHVVQGRHDTVSSALNRLMKNGVAIRHEGLGPRGGSRWASQPSAPMAHKRIR